MRQGHHRICPAPRKPLHAPLTAMCCSGSTRGHDWHRLRLFEVAQVVVEVGPPVERCTQFRSQLDGACKMFQRSAGSGIPYATVCLFSADMMRGPTGAPKAIASARWECGSSGASSKARAAKRCAMWRPIVGPKAHILRPEEFLSAFGSSAPSSSRLVVVRDRLLKVTQLVRNVAALEIESMIVRLQCECRTKGGSGFLKGCFFSRPLCEDGSQPRIRFGELPIRVAVVRFLLGEAIESGDRRTKCRLCRLPITQPCLQ